MFGVDYLVLIVCSWGVLSLFGVCSLILESWSRFLGLGGLVWALCQGFFFRSSLSWPLRFLYSLWLLFLFLLSFLRFRSSDGDSHMLWSPDCGSWVWTF